MPGSHGLLANISRDLLPHARPGEATVRYDSASDELVVDYRLAPYAQAPATVPDIFVIGPDEFSRALEIRKVAQGAYQGRVKIDNRRGLFRIRPLREYEAFPEVGIYRQERELTDYGAHETLLAQIAPFPGGIAGPTPQQIFRTDGRAIPATMQLWPLFLTLAILLTFAEVITRKWGAVRSLFERSPREATA